jgi:hypothetical protein
MAPRISVSPTSLDFKKVETGAFLDKTVTVRNTGNENLAIYSVTPPSPPFSISTDSCSGQSLAPSRTCKVTYGFLPGSTGFFTDTSTIPSNSGDQNPGTVTLQGTGTAGTNYIDIVSPPSPPDGGTFTACDYVSPPTFQWTSGGAFTSIGVQFSVNSDFSGVSLKVNGNLKSNSLTIQKTVWKRILLLPGVSGGPVYWKVIANKKDGTKVESSVFSFTVGQPGPVDNVGISSTSTAPPPTLTWDNNCNIIFAVWFGNQPDFKTRPLKKLSLSFKGNTGTFTLTSSQWLSIRKLVGDVTGNTIYWYVQSQDGLGRRQATDVMSFPLNP